MVPEAAPEEISDALVHRGREGAARGEARVVVAAGDAPHVRVDRYRVHLVEREESDAVGNLRPDAVEGEECGDHLRPRPAAEREQVRRAALEPLSLRSRHQLDGRVPHKLCAVAEAELSQLGLACRREHLDGREGVPVGGDVHPRHQLVARGCAGGELCRLCRLCLCLRLLLRRRLAVERRLGAEPLAVPLAHPVEDERDARHVVVARADEGEEALARLLPQDPQPGQRAGDRLHPPAAGAGPLRVERGEGRSKLEVVDQLLLEPLGPPVHRRKLGAARGLPDRDDAPAENPDVLVDAVLVRPPAKALAVE
mmetsp:Transcript_40989/g.131807  ORF Transcript_40989/g.131807 Transcript_40989/m.131807 type:complete len:311 (-) Transcript_40989:91-1023(-)